MLLFLPGSRLIATLSSSREWKVQSTTAVRCVDKPCPVLDESVVRGLADGRDTMTSP